MQLAVLARRPLVGARVAVGVGSAHLVLTNG